MSSSARGIPPVTTRIFPSAENPLDLALELSEKLRFSEPCPLSLSDGFRAVRPSLRKKDNARSPTYGLFALFLSTLAEDVNLIWGPSWLQEGKGR